MNFPKFGDSSRSFVILKQFDLEGKRKNVETHDGMCRGMSYDMCACDMTCVHVLH